jgi:hypothetical protein
MTPQLGVEGDIVSLSFSARNSKSATPPRCLQA